MERKIIVASHGRFASGIIDSLELICGKNQKIEPLDCYKTEDFDLQQEVKQIILNNQANELIVITDLFGGSVNNEFMQYLGQPNFYLVAGLNLAFLIELVTQLDFIESLAVSLPGLLSRSKEMIQFCNESAHKEMEEEEF